MRGVYSKIQLLKGRLLEHDGGVYSKQNTVFIN